MIEEARGIIYPPVFASLSPAEQKIIEHIVRIVITFPSTQCLIWGGSTAEGARRDMSDVDLWLVTSDPELVRDELIRSMSSSPNVRFVHDSGFLPWLGRLVSAFFFNGSTFSVDIGICQIHDLLLANPGPSPHAIWGDASDAFRHLRPQLYEESEHQRITRVLVNLIKIRKNLTRGYYWEAYECLSRARRELMGLTVVTRLETTIYYNRADRDVEDHLAPEHRDFFAGTAPDYAQASIARAARAIGLATLEYADKLVLGPIREEFVTLCGQLDMLENSRGANL